MRRGRVSIPAVIALLTAGSVFVGAPTPAGAADPGPFTLTDISQTASWSSELEFSTAVRPEACSPDVCDIVEVNVRLPDPESVWAQPGGMLVATQPPPIEVEANIFDLYVYGPGADPATDEPVAKADSFWSAGSHAAWVENPANGLYTIVVVPDTMIELPAHYDGLVSFDRGLTVKRTESKDGEEYQQKFVAFGVAPPPPAVELVPDLVPRPAQDFHIETGTCFNPASPSSCAPRPAQQPSCYPEETAGLNSHPPGLGPFPLRCLRFTQGETNMGDGPLELHIYPGQSRVTPDRGIVADVYQRVYKSDGSVTQDQVGDAFFHSNHGHFHYTPGEGGWWGITLHERLPNGQPGEVVPQATFPAKGICPLDTWNERFGQPGDGPQNYGNDDPYTCITPRHQDPNDPTFPNESYIQAGISVGWRDEYGWAVKDMYIDITNVPDGKYIIVTKQDPGQHLIEKTRANNTAMACVEFSGITARACPPESDLSLAKTGPSGRVPTGRNMTYVLTVANNGPDDASDVSVIDQLPPSVSFVSAAPSQGSCGESAGTVTCALGSMANGAIATVDIVVRPNMAGTVTNTASVSGIEVDPNQTNNTDSVDTSICRITSRRSSIPCG